MRRQNERKKLLALGLWWKNSFMIITTPIFFGRAAQKTRRPKTLNNSSRNRVRMCSIPGAFLLFRQRVCIAMCRICAICAAFHFACRLWSHWLAMFRAILQLVPFGLVFAGSHTVLTIAASYTECDIRCASGICL